MHYLSGVLSQHALVIIQYTQVFQHVAYPHCSFVKLISVLN